MSGNNIKMVVYGRNAEFYDKKINKPFTYVNKGVVKSNLIGYSFNKKYKLGFYKKNTNNKSLTSDVVLIL
jgi:hypothetical protein